MDNFEQHLSNQLQNDKLHFSINPAIRERLMYHMHLKSAKSAVHKNQILPFLSMLFAPKLVAWKLGFVAILVISSMGYNHYNHNESTVQVADSTHTFISIDTLNIHFKDTLSIN
ncbi:MAG: hypothetical protein A2W85_05660 [Bacteroidetes bacterium GWF2_41_31]|nr:MAG: hypothetical protein A2W85_05660 [Bacteroidetes bacterium GWF2_41_31]